MKPRDISKEMKVTRDFVYKTVADFKKATSKFKESGAATETSIE